MSLPDNETFDMAMVDYAAVAARVLGLTVRPEWHDGVVLNLRALAAAAALVETYPLDDELESASVFGA